MRSFLTKNDLVKTKNHFDRGNSTSKLIRSALTFILSSFLFVLSAFLYVLSSLMSIHGSLMFILRSLIQYSTSFLIFQSKTKNILSELIFKSIRKISS